MEQMEDFEKKLFADRLRGWLKDWRERKAKHKADDYDLLMGARLVVACDNDKQWLARVQRKPAAFCSQIERKAEMWLHYFDKDLTVKDIEAARDEVNLRMGQYLDSETTSRAINGTGKNATDGGFNTANIKEARGEHSGGNITAGDTSAKPMGDGKDNPRYGLRANHDELPLEIQKIPEQQLQRRQEMRAVYEHLKVLTEMQADNALLFERLQTLLAMDDEYRKEWKRYDLFENDLENNE